MSDMAKNLILWVVIAIVLMSVFNNFTSTQSGPQATAYSDFIEQVRQGQVKEVTISGRPSRERTSPASVSPPTARATTAWWATCSTTTW